MSEIFDSIRKGAEQAIDIANGKAESATFRAHLVESVDVKAVRRKVGLTQEAFSLAFQINLNTLRQWERGARIPDGPAQILLKVINHDPDAVRRALETA